MFMIVQNLVPDTFNMSSTRKNSITFSQTRKGSMARSMQRPSFFNASRNDPLYQHKFIEKENIIEMNKFYVKMMDQLEYFRIDK